MGKHSKWVKIAILAVMIGGLLFLHYLPFHGLQFHQAVFRMLFYLPLILGTWWFGRKGTYWVLATVSPPLVPFALYGWQDFSFQNIARLSEGLLYIAMGFLLAFLVERERKRQQALIEAKSLAAIGQTVSEIAHDMKTPLMAIGGYANLISKRLPADDSDRQKLDVIIKETAHMEAMVQEMLDFSRPVSIKPERAEMNGLVEDAIQIARPMAQDGGITLTPRYSDSPLQVYADPNKMRQVLVNLLTNAVQASPSGASVVVETQRHRDTAVVKVADCGCGIHEEIADTVFQPFFSTKERGTGLGLSVVKRIAEAHRGSVSFHNNPEKGATFFVELPLVESQSY
jgi:signal transduction histidine kinase